MATTTQMPTTPQTTPEVTTNVTSEREDYVVGYLVTTKDGKDEHTPAFYPIQDEEQQKFVKEQTDTGKFKPSFPVTVSVPRAKNLAGIKEICPDEEEAAANFNRGAKQKAANRLKAKLLDVDQDGVFTFDPAGNDEDGKPNLTNGVLDMTSEIASPSKRKVLTEEEKLDRFLEQFPEPMRNAMKSAYLAQRNAV